jgi:hypothetical protein
VACVVVTNAETDPASVAAADLLLDAFVADPYGILSGMLSGAAEPAVRGKLET